MVANPSSLYSMRYKDENIQQLELKGLIESARGIYPSISMANLGGKLDGCLLIHDENVVHDHFSINVLLIILKILEQ